MRSKDLYGITMDPRYHHEPHQLLSPVPVVMPCSFLHPGQYTASLLACRLHKEVLVPRQSLNVRYVPQSSYCSPLLQYDGQSTRN